MKISDAVKKYGQRMFKKMSKHLIGITVVIQDGEEDIPESDLELAYKIVNKKPVHPLEWD
jgi:hypothetical protein